MTGWQLFAKVAEAWCTFYAAGALVTGCLTASTPMRPATRTMVIFFWLPLYALTLIGSEPDDD